MGRNLNKSFLPHIRKQHEGARDTYFNQQHKQLDLTTIAPKTTHWALWDLLKTIVVNSIVNYRQFGGIF